MAGIHRRGLIAAGLAVAGSARAQPATTPGWAVPGDAEIKAILVDRIDVKRQGVGIVVGVIDAKGRRIVAHGALDKGDPRPLNGDTLFEIGSETKVFTSLLLAEAVRRGEVTLDEPLAKLLPEGVHVPERGGKQIELVDLATHTSGLPRMPSNFAPKDPANPYADYTAEQMFQFVSGYQLTRDIGERYEYSNLGAGLLGQALARRAGVDYPTLVRTRITGPLGMKDTVVALTPALQARMARGHNVGLEPVSNWDLPAMAGAGALRSTTNDMLTFLSYELGFRPTPLKAAMDDQFAVRRATPQPNMKVALAWHINSTPNAEVFWHNGGTGGFRTWMGFDPKARVGVVVMTNTANATGGDDIGFHLVAGTPLARVPVNPATRPVVTLTAAEMAALAGRYQLAPAMVVTIVPYNGRLFAQLTGQQGAEIFPTSSTEVFWKVVDAQATFDRGADGKATRLVLHQNGRDQPAPRIP
jgi:CubicO group peptidase (beta-lactamase class C family)